MLLDAAGSHFWLDVGGVSGFLAGFRCAYGFFSPGVVGFNLWNYGVLLGLCTGLESFQKKLGALT